MFELESLRALRARVPGAWLQVSLLVIGIGAAAVLNVVYMVFVGRTLGPAAYSDFAAAVAIASVGGYVLGPLAPFGAQLSAELLASGRKDQIPFLARSLLRRLFIYAVPLIAILMIVAPFVSEVLGFRSSATLSIAVLTIFFILVRSIVRAVLRGSLSFPAFSAGLVFEAAVRLVAGGIMLHWAATAAVAISAYPIAGALASLLVLVQLGLRRSDSAEVPVSFQSIGRAEIHSFLLLVGMAGFQHVDIIIINITAPATEAGIYGSASVFAKAAGTLLLAFEALLIPLVSTKLSRGDSPAPVLRMISMGTVILLLPILLVTFFRGEALVGFLFGSSFSAAGPILTPLVLAIGFIYLSYFFGQTLLIMKCPEFLGIFLGGLAVQLAALAVWNDTPGEVAVVVLASSFVTAIGMALLTVRKIGALQSQTRTHDPVS